MSGAYKAPITGVAYSNMEVSASFTYEYEGEDHDAAMIECSTQLENAIINAKETVKDSRTK